ncbi:MAG: acyl-ACP--UDP-N-acetylglucosamine O-acyltransferase, partial [Verrucomicrobiota bacterium]
MSFHPTALIHADAQIGDNVTIGPYAVIEGAARIGDGCVIQAHAIIGAHVVMGKNNLIGYGAVIGGDPQDFAFRPEVKSEVRIGDGNKIREYCTVHRGSSEGSQTVVGDACFLMGGTHLAHNVRLSSHVIIANNSLLGGHVTVEERVFIGGGCVFHQHIRVGRLAICQGASAFSKDVPPFTLGAEHNGVAGLNVVGLRRAGIEAKRRAEIKEAFMLVYRRGLNTAQALAASREKSWGAEATLFFEFIAAAKKRG